MATLKPKATSPGYEFISTDFSILAIQQKDYKDIFQDHHLLGPGNYEKEKNRITKEWTEHPITGGNRSLDSSLQELFGALQTAQNKERERRVFIDILFARIYGFFDEMVNDNNIGWLEDAKFAEYLQEYKTAIEANKAIGLICYDKPQLKTIQKQIASTVNKNK